MAEKTGRPRNPRIPAIMARYGCSRSTAYRMAQGADRAVAEALNPPPATAPADPPSPPEPNSAEAESRRIWTELAIRLIDGRPIDDISPKLTHAAADDYREARAEWLQAAKTLADAIGDPNSRVLERLRAAAGVDVVELRDLGADPADRKLQALLDRVDEAANWLEFTITQLAGGWNPPRPIWRANAIRQG